MVIKNIRKTSIFAFALGLLIFVLERIFTKRGLDESTDTLVQYFLIMQLYSFVITFSNVLFNQYLDNYITWKTAPKKRLIIGSLSNIIITSILIVVLRFVVVVVIYKKSFDDFLATGIEYYLFSFIIMANVLITLHVIYFIKNISAKKVKEHKVISKTQSAKFESLKNQLDPHFLFNSLNVLTSLIEENPRQAEKFTTKLSKIYRYVLTQKSEDLVPVNEELKFARTYMDLLKMRFEEAVTFDILDDLTNEELKIVPLSLQLLLENAVKHNVITAKTQLNVRIYKEAHYLIIENNINPKSNLEKSTKVGLQNIKDRYALVIRSAVIIEDDGKTFTVKLPLLTQKANIMNTSYSNQEKYYRAKKQVREIKDFYGSLISYIFVIPFLYFIWKTYTPHTIQWFWFPAFGWGMGLVFQGIKAFNRIPFLGRDWEKRKIQELMDEDNDNEVRF